MSVFEFFWFVVKIAFAAVVAQCVYYRYLHPLSRYPGPLLASFSNLWKFSVFLEGKHHLVEQRLHERYGRVVRTGPTSLSFSDLADFETIYGFNKSFEKGDFYDFGRDSGHRESVFTARTDAVHREHRRMVVGPALSSAKITTYEPIIAKNVSTLISRLQASLKDRDAVNIAELVHRYTVDTMLEIIYGASLSSQPWTDTAASAGLMNGLRAMSKMAWATATVPWLSSLMSTPIMISIIRRPTYDTQGNMTGMSAMVGRTRDLITVHPELALESFEPSIVKNYLSVSEDNSSHMPHEQIWRESFNLTFAGPGSTAAALTSVLYRLGTPEGREWQEKIRDEQLNAVGQRASISPILPCLMAVIKETLRLHAPFPTAFPRVIAPGAESALPDLPAPLPVGTVVSSHTYILGHSSALWGSDVESWKPERWLADPQNDDDDAVDDEKKKQQRQLEDLFVVFGKGPRRCIGRDIAMLVVAHAVMGVLGAWDLRSLGPLRGKSWSEMQYEECVIGFTERRGVTSQ